MTMTRLDAVLATIEEQASSIDQKVEQAQRFAQETERLRVSGSALNNAVTVTVDGVGQPIDVAFDGSWADVGPDRLGAAVLEAHAQAKRRLAFHVQELGQSIFGPGSSSADLVTESYRNRFGYEEDER